MIPLKSAERAQVEEIVEQVKQEYQKTVHQIRWELDRDWSGDWSLYFRVVMKDSATRGKRLFKTTTIVQDALRQRIDPLELGLFCYFRFRSESEQAELREPAWA
jgi:hypothetical protein